MASRRKQPKYRMTPKSVQDGLAGKGRAEPAKPLDARTTVLLDSETMGKLKSVARMENRSESQQIRRYVENGIRADEATYGAIFGG